MCTWVCEEGRLVQLQPSCTLTSVWRDAASCTAPQTCLNEPLRTGERSVGCTRMEDPRHLTCDDRSSDEFNIYVGVEFDKSVAVCRHKC